MQQTEQYQLNLIENSDYLSPEPINDNTCKFEAALCGLTRAQCFTYTGTGVNNRTFTFDKPPLALVLCGPTADYGHVVLWRGMSSARGTGMKAEQYYNVGAIWGANSVQIYTLYGGAALSDWSLVAFNALDKPFFGIALLGELEDPLSNE